MASEGLQETFHLLARTENRAALELLLAALDSPHEGSRHGALRALLARPSPEGHREILRRLPKMDEACRAIVNERPDRLVRAVNAALEDANPRQVEIACDTIVTYRLYDALPALVRELIESEDAPAGLLAQSALKLIEAYYAELSGAAQPRNPKNQDALRHRLTTSLEDAARKFYRHERTEIIEAFLMVAKAKNVTLYRMLQRSSDSCHQPIVDLLADSSRGGIIRLLLGFLDDPQMPQVVVDVIAGRTDLRFVDHLLKSVGSRPSKLVSRSLLRFRSFAWMNSDGLPLDQLDGAAQAGVVRLLVHSAMKRPQVLRMLGLLLDQGKPQGRRAAAAALEGFQGPESDGLIVLAIHDDDPKVCAPLIPLLRPRSIPGALMILIRMVDSPSDEIHEALRKALPEFSFRQLMINFELLPDSLQSTAAHLVRKIDTDIRDKLTHEMQSPSRVRRRRAVLAAEAMGMARPVEALLIGLLTDEDHLVRVAAAEALANCQSAPSWEALRDALFDRSVSVQQAAGHSLERISLALKEHLEEMEEKGQPDELPEPAGEAAV